MAQALSPQKKYPLQDVDKPNLLEEFFNYDEVPKIVFDHQIEEYNLPQDICITDTTFRDGQQAHPPYTVKQIVDLYDMLHRLGGPNGVIRQCEFFLYTDKDKEAVTQCIDKGYKFPEVTGWIRAVKSDFQLVKQMGLKETGILTSASDYHIFLKLNKTRRQAMDSYLNVVKAALEADIKPRCHLEDATRADFYGFILPFCQALMELAEESKVPIKIRICDTMGYGIPNPGVKLPRSVPKLVQLIKREAGVPSEQLEWHGHNDFHRVLANASTAWLYGCSAANGTLLGFGERTGNPPLEGLIIDYIALKGHANGINTTVITEIAEYFEKEIGMAIPSNYPFVGRNFNVTSAGIHADGLQKFEPIYNIFNTTKILRRPIEVNVTDKSGVAGIAHWINDYLKKQGRAGDATIDKRHPGIGKIAMWVDEEYKTGRTTCISPEEIIAQAKIHVPEIFSEPLVKRS